MVLMNMIRVPYVSGFFLQYSYDISEECRKHSFDMVGYGIFYERAIAGSHLCASNSTAVGDLCARRSLGTRGGATGDWQGLWRPGGGQACRAVQVQGSPWVGVGGGGGALAVVGG
jgi:hypothetical protein